MKPYDLSQYMYQTSLASGAGLMGYSPTTTYAPGTVGEALQNTGTGAGGGSGVVTTDYIYNANVATAPASGEMRFDVAPPNTATNLKLSETTVDGTNTALAFSYLAPGQRIYIQDKVDPTRYLKASIVGTPSDQGNWWLLPILVTEASTPSVAAERCTIGWPASAAAGSNTPTNVIPKGGSVGFVNSQLFDTGVNVGIGTNAPGYKLDVAGAVNANFFQMPAAGTPAAPSLTFVGDFTTGLYQPAAGQIATAISGVQVGLWSSAGLTFVGAGKRIMGDFSTTTVANRLAFQTSTPNDMTIVTAIPNGTSLIAGFQAYNNSNPVNTGMLNLYIDSAAAHIQSINLGTGTLLPMFFDTGGATRLFINTAGNLGVNVNPYASSSILQTSGDVSIFGAQPTLMYNGYYASGWKAQAAGFVSGIKLDTTVGALQFLSSTASFGAGTASDVREVGRFLANGGFCVGTPGGDYGTNWVAIFRRDQNATADLAIVNGATGASASANLRQITGTGNSYANHNLVDNNGAPYATLNLGSAVASYAISFAGSGFVNFFKNGSVGINRPAPKEILDVNGNIAMPGGNWIYTGYDGSGNWVGGVRAGVYFDGADQSLAFGSAGSTRGKLQNNGDLRMWGSIMALPSGSTDGGVALTATPASNLAGYVAFWMNGGGTRYGYIGDYGWGGDIQYINEAGGGHAFNGTAVTITNRLYTGGSNPGIAGTVLIQQQGGTALQTWTGSGTYNAAAFNYLGAINGTINCLAGSVTYNSASDIRLKTNIKNSEVDPGAIIDAIPVRSFDWKEFDQHNRIGLIAQEVFPHYPEAVTEPTEKEWEEGNPDAIWMIDFSKFTPLLLMEAQGLRARVKELETRLAALEATQR